MVLLCGPRQCGKTTLARGLEHKQSGAYYNWDVDRHRKLIRSSTLDESAGLWIFDELHKFRSWRNWLKGTYDLHHDRHPILVTGSARLDLYRRGGDSLQGRYFFHRLHPFTLSELEQNHRFSDSNQIPDLLHKPRPSAQKGLDDMLLLGGFPEPLLSASKRKADRWRLSYGTRLVREEIRDLERVQELDKIELLFERLSTCVGSVLSINSLREDLEASFPAVKNWVNILDRTYATFRLPPFGAPRVKAVKKEQKLYLWDWARVEEPSACFENLIAVHLLRLAHWMEDVEGVKSELRYFRDTARHEVDFILLRKSQPWLAVEVKMGDRPLDSGLRYLLERVRIPFAFQLSAKGDVDSLARIINGCRVRLVPATHFLINLP
jgi:hypothetical protein